MYVVIKSQNHGTKIISHRLSFFAQIRVAFSNKTYEKMSFKHLTQHNKLISKSKDNIYYIIMEEKQNSIV